MIIAVSHPPMVCIDETIQRLAQQHGVAVEKDSSREVCAEFGFQTVYDMPPELQQKARHLLVDRHAALVASGKSVILPYSIVSILADWMRWNWSCTPADQWELVLKKARTIAVACDTFYHIEQGPLVPYDGYVWRDSDNSKQLNTLMKSLYKELGVESKVAFIS